jgi:serine/threonine protein kinase
VIGRILAHYRITAAIGAGGMGEVYRATDTKLGRDVFSLGIILYELASGERPFRRGSSAELASAILRDAPRPLAERRHDLPGTLLRAVERCLAQLCADYLFANAR